MNAIFAAVFLAAAVIFLLDDPAGFLPAMLAATSLPLPRYVPQDVLHLINRQAYMVKAIISQQFNVLLSKNLQTAFIHNIRLRKPITYIYSFLELKFRRLVHT